MHITSTAFAHNGKIPQQYTCDGQDINPPLMIEGVPSGAKSLVLIVDDPDASQGLWVHWTLWNIPPGTKEIPENGVPGKAVEGETSFGESGYGGPCPPSGEHRYFFKVYALDMELNLPSDADKEDIEEAMVGHVLDHAELIGLYQRK